MVILALLGVIIVFAVLYMKNRMASFDKVVLRADNGDSEEQQELG